MSDEWEDWRDGVSDETWKAVLKDELKKAKPVPIREEKQAEEVAPKRKPRRNFAPRPTQSHGRLDFGSFLKVGYQEKQGDSLHLFRHKTNKLRVVLAPKSSNNVSALSVCFLVGSKAETLGTTGSAHILEHMLFKGSEHFNKENGNDLWSVLAGAGVRLNASTSKDRTEFNSTLPSVKLLYKALEIEADRLAAPKLAGLSTEYVVVRNEYERGKNNSQSLLREMVFKTAFPMSSCGIPTIGSREDIESILAHQEDLRRFHRKNYCCANCIVVVSGVFGDAESLLGHIDKCFGKLPPGECLREVDPATGLDASETEHDQMQRGCRGVDIAGEMPLVILGFRSPPSGVCREAVALELLAHWMSAGQSGMFADMLKSDRALHSIEVDYERVHGQTLFNVWITPVSIGDTTELCRRLQIAVMRRLQQAGTSDFGMSQTQMENTKKGLHEAWNSERSVSCTSYTSTLVESLSRCNSPFDVFARHDVLESITPEDIARVAQSIFVSHRCTIGRVLPELTKVTISDPPCTPYKVTGDRIVPVFTPASAHVVPYETAQVTKGGVFLHDPNSKTTCFRVHIPSGATKSDIETNLTAALATLGVQLEDGTVLTEGDMMSIFEKEGTMPSIRGNHTGITLSLDVQKDKDAAGLARLIKRALTHPVVNEDDFDRKKHYFCAETVGLDYDVNTTAAKLFSQSVFHEPHDPRARLAGQDESQLLKGLTHTDSVSFLKELSSRPAWVTCIAPDEETLQIIRAVFEVGDATPEHDQALKLPSPSPYANKVMLHPMDGKTSCTMILGCASSIGPKDPRSVALSLGVDSLGGGFTSTLMQKVREDQGLTYGIYSNTGVVDPSTSLFTTTATFAPELMEKGVSMSRSLVKKWREEGIDQERLEGAKRRALGAVALASDSASAVCNSLHAARLHCEQPAVRCASLPQRIQAVTLDDVNAAIQSLPPFSEFVCVAAGAVPKTKLEIKL